MDDVARKIQQYEAKIKAHNDEKSRLLGKKEVADQRLKDLGFDSVEAAEEHVKTEQARLDKVEEELIADIKEFEETYAQYLEE